MRVYLPATSSDLRRSVASPDAIGHRLAHAVTADLQRNYPEEDQDGLEAIALEAAAEDSVRRALLEKTASPSRVVLAADVPEDHIKPADAELTDSYYELVASHISVVSKVPWRNVVAIFIDDPAQAQTLAEEFRTGDTEEAVRIICQRELLWYDVTERESVEETLLKSGLQAADSADAPATGDAPDGE